MRTKSEKFEKIAEENRKTVAQLWKESQIEKGKKVILGSPLSSSTG